ncbi:putative cell division-related protein [Hirschfeldia incana]|nr:putative cell division-related protein [Hirschfeldia incana]
MGCVWCKPSSSAIEDSKDSSPPRDRFSNKSSSEYRVSRPVSSSSRREDHPLRSRTKEQQQPDAVVSVSVRSKQASVSRGESLSSSRRDQKNKKKTENAAAAASNFPMGITIAKGVEAEYVAAGWPPWLASVAGEAIKGWVPRRADSFEKLDKIGQGTYSNVYRARDLDQKKIVALKKVRFDNLEPESVRFMAREIQILRRLDHPNIIKLEGLVTSRMSCSLYLVFEYMEHDLAGLASHPAVKFSESQVKCYLQQLLRGLDHCHTRGVLHRDIKGSNLLIDNSGVLKIADFGLASFFDPSHQTQPLTSRVVTLWYRPPELLLGATRYGAGVDLWSTGCILAELYAGKPIMPGRTEVEQLHKIFKLCGSPSEDYWVKSRLPHATIFKPTQPYKRIVDETFKEFPQPALALLETLLSVNPDDRGTANSALQSEFFSARPLPCDPSSLPKYPPSKELDARMRDEESRRQAGGNKGDQRHQERRGTKDSRAIPAPDANAELVASMQKRQSQANRSRSEKFNPHPGEVASGFPIDPPRSSSQAFEPNRESQGNIIVPHKRASHSGPLTRRSASAKGRRNYQYQDPSQKVSSTAADYSSMPGFAATRTGASQQETCRGMNRLPGSFKEASEEATHEENGRSNKKDPILLGYGSKGHKIHYSGPLVVPSGNMDQVLKDHDRHIQEAVRRARIDKARVKKHQAEEASSQQVSTNHPSSVSSR